MWAATTRTKTYRRLAFAGPIAVLLLVSVASSDRLSRANAHCVPEDKLQTLLKREDRFKNYDFRDRQIGHCNTDWPVDFLFWNDASTSKVKNKFEPVGYDDTGSTMQGYVDDGSGWEWDPDPGRKNYSPTDCAFGDMEHFRLYGAIYTDTRMYNLDWGYYVLGTAHIDHHECTGGWSGDSEVAEHRIAADARDAPGFGAVHDDDIAFFNSMDYRVASDGHVIRNNGAGTTVRVP